jgi:hypothetical protein
MPRLRRLAFGPEDQGVRRSADIAAASWWDGNRDPEFYFIQVRSTMQRVTLELLIGLQVFVVVFIALHDVVPLGRLNNLVGVRAVDTRGRFLATTVLSTLPFLIGLVASVVYARRGFPGWVMWWLWISYGFAAYGALRAWWIPYLLIEDPARIERYRTRFAGTHAFLPEHNGIRPDTLHVVLHIVLVAILILLMALSF